MEVNYLEDGEDGVESEHVPEAWMARGGEPRCVI